jgi:hypothetical protein
MKKGILINPTTKTIEWVDVKDWKDINNHIESERFQCVEINELNDLWVDEEFLFKEGDNWFFLEGTHCSVRNKGLILGVDEEGESCDSTLSIDYVKSRTKFMTTYEKQVMERFKQIQYT